MAKKTQFTLISLADLADLQRRHPDKLAAALRRGKAGSRQVRSYVNRLARRGKS